MPMFFQTMVAGNRYYDQKLTVLLLGSTMALDVPDIELLTQLATVQRQMSATDRVQASTEDERTYLSYLTVLNEPISQEDILLFLKICGIQIEADTVEQFTRIGLSKFWLTPELADGRSIPFFRVELSIKKYLWEQLSESDKKTRHTYADQFYRHIFATLLQDLIGSTDMAGGLSNLSIADLAILPGGLIDVGAHRPQMEGFHKWSVLRAYYWQQHLFQLGKFGDAAHITNSICFSLARQGYGNLAKEMLARNAMVTSGLHRAVAITNLATLSRESQEHAIALKLYKQVIWPFVRFRASSQLAGVFAEMSNIYRDRGQLLRAMIFQHMSAALRRHIRDLHGTAICNNQLSILYRTWGWYTASLRCSRQAEKYWRSVEDEVNLAKTLVSQGNIYNSMKEPSSALICFDESLSINNRIGSLGEAASSVSGKARAHLQLRNYDQAKALLEEAISLRQRGNDHRVGIEYENMGQVYEAQGKLTLALGWYQKALPQFEKYLPTFAQDCRQKIAELNKSSRQR